MTATSAPRSPAVISDARARLSLGDRLQPVLLIGSIAAGLSLADLQPELGESLGWIVPAGVFALIYLVMLRLDAGAVAEALTRRRFLGIAVVLNFVVNPLLAWGLAAMLLSGEPDLRVGLILFLVTPCIGWYLIFTELAGGHVGLGVSLLGVNTVLQVLLLPLYLWAFTGQSARVDLGGVVESIALFLVVPAIAAFVTRRLIAGSDWDVDQTVGGRPVELVKTVVLAAVIVAMFASEGGELLDNPDVVARVVPPLLAFFALAFVIALAVGAMARLPHAETALLVFTTTSRNSEASLAIAATAFASPLVGLTVLIGPVIELPLLVVMVRLLSGAARRRVAAAPPDLTSTHEGWSTP